MRATELQLGDYVNYRGQIIKVTSLYDKGGSNEIGWSDKECVWVNADNVEPIPLTIEILENNGWKSMKNGSGDFILTKPLVGNSATVTKTINGYEMSHGAFNGLSIHYIHQLQHALRLCGIEKEIVL